MKDRVAGGHCVGTHRKRDGNDLMSGHDFFQNWFDLTEANFDITQQKIDLILAKLELLALPSQQDSLQFEYLKSEFELLANRQRHLERFLGWYFRILSEMNPAFGERLAELQQSMAFEFGEQ